MRAHIRREHDGDCIQANQPRSEHRTARRPAFSQAAAALRVLRVRDLELPHDAALPDVSGDSLGAGAVAAIHSNPSEPRAQNPALIALVYDALWMGGQPQAGWVQAPIEGPSIGHESSDSNGRSGRPARLARFAAADSELGAESRGGGLCTRVGRSGPRTNRRRKARARATARRRSRWRRSFAALTDRKAPRGGSHRLEAEQGAGLAPRARTRDRRAANARRGNRVARASCARARAERGRGLPRRGGRPGNRTRTDRSRGSRDADRRRDGEPPQAPQQPDSRAQRHGLVPCARRAPSGPALGSGQPEAPANRMSLFWRVFSANAAILAVGILVLGFTPVSISKNASLPEIADLIVGLLVMVVVNWFVLRPLFRPLERLPADGLGGRALRRPAGHRPKRRRGRDARARLQQDDGAIRDRAARGRDAHATRRRRSGGGSRAACTTRSGRR